MLLQLDHHIAAGVADRRLAVGFSDNTFKAMPCGLIFFRQFKSSGLQSVFHGVLNLARLADISLLLEMLDDFLCVIVGDFFFLRHSFAGGQFRIHNA